MSKPNRSDVHMKGERPKRVPLTDQARDILTVVGKNDDFVYRWVNDVDGRIDRYKLAGYEIVTDTELEIGQRTVDTASTVGTPVSKKVGPGITAYLMRILREYYEEDQAAKQDEITQREKAMLNEARQERYGDVKLERNK